MEETIHEKMIVMNPTSFSYTSNIVQKFEEFSRQCKICGAPALHNYYGVLSCSPCKMFFKRNALTGQKRFECVFSGQCDVNINNRRICSSCRLAKCFTSGMRSTLIRCSLLKNIKSKQKQDKMLKSIAKTSNILQTIQEQNQPHRLPTLNLLQSDNSTLNANQWTLLSNLFHSYDESKLLLIAQQLMNENNLGKSMKSIDSTLPTQFFMKAYETTGDYFNSNNDLRRLSLDNCYTFLRNAAESINCLGTIFSWRRSQVYKCKHFVNACIDLYGQASVDMIEHILKYLDSDIVIIKLALSLFTFSNNITIFSSITTINSINTLDILHIQNTYAEVTWKYILYKYGFYQSIQRFMNLIQCLLAATNALYKAHDIEKHENDIELLVENIELELLLDDIEHIN
ncbi:unnamed protein product [Rotaria sp. Silwood1]|nr:unnamed protein product [Rotaria sp. Silwood1]CAF1242852.1 unnamed protein product [Rotaria sp. Silwood1]CAF3471738.1 unnamed protein product [Rotaria sp. Silwood1]CAF4847643.1 unnamed protein product [Rotaria sp. Silwood1]